MGYYYSHLGARSSPNFRLLSAKWVGSAQASELGPKFRASEPGIRAGKPRSFICYDSLTLAKRNPGYEAARARYADFGVDTDRALKQLERKSISIHCWQGDDVAGFENPAGAPGGGLQVTGNYPGRARNPDELRGDLEFALSMIPGRHAANLHAMYAEWTGARPDRDSLEPEHFGNWLSWAESKKIGLDFNATLFAHPKAGSGFTLSSKDRAVRSFWVEHVKRCRSIAAHFGAKTGRASIHNLWIPDGMKDTCIDKAGYQDLLVRSLDEIYAEKLDPARVKDSLESKLFGIGSESFVVGSHEFYLSYALRNRLMLCLDMGHFHPTESAAEKIPSLLRFMPEILIHVSRGIRWDSDHVAVFDDQLRAVAQETVRADALDRVHFALDYFDASLNRPGAWIVGARAALKALLYAQLEPVRSLVELEEAGNYLGRLAMLEELKSLPFGAVWDRFCEIHNVPAGNEWISPLSDYERLVLARRT